MKRSPAARRRAAAYIWVLFETLNAVPNSAPNYNGTPTQQLPVVRLDEEGHRSLDLLR